MLAINNVSKSYGPQVLFDGVSFAIHPGERIGLVGRNGSGKTTLFRLILGEEEPDSGSITIPKGYSIGHLSQTISFTGTSVLEEACTSLPRHDDGVDETYRTKAILQGLGFSPADFDRPPHLLSGGFQIRLNLAKVLVAQPRLLLLDEPTNYLDIVSVRWLGQFLKAWRDELVLITHDRGFMDSVATHTIGIHRTRIRKIAGSTYKLYDQILQEEEIYEQTRVNEEKKRRDLEQFINRFRAQATRAKAVQSKIKLLQKTGSRERLERPRDLDFEFRFAPTQAKWLLEADAVHFSYPGGPTLIASLGFAVGRKDRIGVIGKNGQGKTTLLSLLGGELLPKSGTVTRHASTEIAYFGQTNIDRLNPDNTVEEEILSSLPEWSRNGARNICGAMLFEGDRALKKIEVLSGGEKSRVLLGKLLTRPANLLLLDEPTNHLDMASVDSLVEAVEAFDGAVIIATHSEMILHALATRLIVFDAGETILFEGTYQDFLDRVGWKSEQEERSQADATPAAMRPSAQRRDLKRMRAELVNQRSRVLMPLQRDMDRIENEIMRLEAQVEDDNRAMVRAAQFGQGRSISELSINIYQAKKEIERLFGELEVLSVEHSAKSRQFEQLFAELEDPAKTV